MFIRRFAALIGLFLLGAFSTANVQASTANVVLSVTQSGSPFAGGRTNTYLISLSNKGTANSDLFTVQASIPINTSVSKAQAGGAVCTGMWPCKPGEVLYWQDKSLNAGQSETLQFAAQLKTPAPADGSTLATTVTTSLSTAAIKAQSTVRSAGGLQVGVSCPPTAVSAAGTLSCIISYGNSGASMIKANLSYTFSSGLTVLSHTPGGQVGSGIITWPALALTAGASGYELATLQVPKGLPAGNNLTQTVSLQSATAGPIGATAGTEAFVAGTDPLEIGVSAAPDPVQPGHTVTYSIHLSNTSTSGTNLFTPYASVPNYMSVTQAQAGGAVCSSNQWPCESGEELLWNDQSLHAGGGETLQFSALVSSTSPPPKGSVLTSTISTGLGGSATSQVLVAAAGPELALTAPEQMPASGQYSYTLTYGNAGSSTEDTALVMALPAGTTYVSASPGAVESGGIVTWKAADLAPGQSASQQLTVQAPKDVGTIVTGSAEVIDATTRLSYSRATADTVIASTDPLEIGVSAAPDPVQPGHTVTYSIHLSNTSTSGTNLFTPYASVPNYMSVTQAQAGGAVCSSNQWPCESGEELLWNDQSLHAGGGETLQFSALVSSTSPPPKGSVLTSTISTGLGGSATSQVLVAAAGPELALTAPEQMPASGQYSYTLTYGNAGSSTEDTALVMALPAGTTYVSASPGAVESGGIVTWKAADLAPGQSASQQLTVQAPKDVGTIVTGSAEVIDATTRLSYSRATADTVIASTDPLEIGVSAAPDPVQPGHTVTYSIHLSNTSTSGTNLFTPYASVPNYMSVTQAQAGGAVCSSNQWPCESGEELLWNDQSLHAGGGETLQFSALVSSTSPPPKGSVLISTITTGLGGSAVSVVTIGTK